MRVAILHLSKNQVNDVSGAFSGECFEIFHVQQPLPSFEAITAYIKREKTDLIIIAGLTLDDRQKGIALDACDAIRKVVKQQPNAIPILFFGDLTDKDCRTIYNSGATAVYPFHEVDSVRSRAFIEPGFLREQVNQWRAISNKQPAKTISSVGSIFVVGSETDHILFLGEQLVLQNSERIFLRSLVRSNGGIKNADALYELYAQHAVKKLAKDAASTVKVAMRRTREKMQIILDAKCRNIIPTPRANEFLVSGYSFGVRLGGYGIHNGNLQKLAILLAAAVSSPADKWEWIGEAVPSLKPRRLNILGPKMSPRQEPRRGVTPPLTRSSFVAAAPKPRAPKIPGLDAVDLKLLALLEITPNARKAAREVGVPYGKAIRATRKIGMSLSERKAASPIQAALPKGCGIPENLHPQIIAALNVHGNLSEIVRQFKDYNLAHESIRRLARIKEIDYKAIRDKWNQQHPDPTKEEILAALRQNPYPREVSRDLGKPYGQVYGYFQYHRSEILKSYEATREGRIPAAPESLPICAGEITTRSKQASRPETQELSHEAEPANE